MKTFPNANNIGKNKNINVNNNLNNKSENQNIRTTFKDKNWEKDEITTWQELKFLTSKKNENQDSQSNQKELMNILSNNIAAEKLKEFSNEFIEYDANKSKNLFLL